jgi:hypothetical protein
VSPAHPRRPQTSQVRRPSRVPGPRQRTQVQPVHAEVCRRLPRPPLPAAAAEPTSIPENPMPAGRPEDRASPQAAVPWRNAALLQTQMRLGDITVVPGRCVTNC